MKSIELTRGLSALVDDEFFDELRKYCWMAVVSRKTHYAVRYFKTPDGVRHPIYMHREVARLAGMDVSQQVDHEDGDGINNRLANLRVATHGQNQQNKGRQKNNTSGYKGVTAVRNGKWQAQIKVDGKYKYIGTYATKELAAAAYAETASQLHGEFARTI